MFACPVCHSNIEIDDGATSGECACGAHFDVFIWPETPVLFGEGSPEEEESDPIIGHDPLWEWRIDQFKRLLFSLENGYLLTSAGVSPREASNLLEDGCSHELVIKILL